MRYYKRGIEQYTVPRIGTTKLSKLTSQEIQNLYKDLLESGPLREQQEEKHPGLSGSTVRGVHTMQRPESGGKGTAADPQSR